MLTPNPVRIRKELSGLFYTGDIKEGLDPKLIYNAHSQHEEQVVGHEDHEIARHAESHVYDVHGERIDDHGQGGPIVDRHEAKLKEHGQRDASYQQVSVEYPTESEPKVQSASSENLNLILYDTAHDYEQQKDWSGLEETLPNKAGGRDHENLAEQLEFASGTDSLHHEEPNVYNTYEAAGNDGGKVEIDNNGQGDVGLDDLVNSLIQPSTEKITHHANRDDPHMVDNTDQLSFSNLHRNTTRPKYQLTNHGTLHPFDPELYAKLGYWPYNHIDGDARQVYYAQWLKRHSGKQSDGDQLTGANIETLLKEKLHRRNKRYVETIQHSVHKGKPDESVEAVLQRKSRMDLRGKSRMDVLGTSHAVLQERTRRDIRVRGKSQMDVQGKPKTKSSLGTKGKHRNAHLHRKYSSQKQQTYNYPSKEEHERLEPVRIFRRDTNYEYKNDHSEPENALKLDIEKQKSDGSEQAKEAQTHPADHTSYSTNGNSDQHKRWHLEHDQTGGKLMFTTIILPTGVDGTDVIHQSSRLKWRCRSSTCALEH